MCSVCKLCKVRRNISLTDNKIGQYIYNIILMRQKITRDSFHIVDWMTRNKVNCPCIRGCLVVHITTNFSVSCLVAWLKEKGSQRYKHYQTIRSVYLYHSLTHWGRVTHICVSKLYVGSDNGLSPGRRQAIIWHIVNSNLRNKLQWNLKRNSCVFIQENEFENVVCEMASILSRPQFVKEIDIQTPINCHLNACYS